MYRTRDKAIEVRSEIVRYVVNERSKFSIMTDIRNGDNYSTSKKYFYDMIKNDSKLTVAGLIFPLNFKVYRNGLTYTESASNLSDSV